MDPRDFSGSAYFRPGGKVKATLTQMPIFQPDSRRSEDELFKAPARPPLTVSPARPGRGLLGT